MAKHEHSMMPHLPKKSMKAHASHPTRDKAESMRPKDRVKGKAACPDCGMKDCKCG